MILISSIKTIDEAPAYFAFFRNIPLYKLIPKNAIASAGVMIKPMFGYMSSDEVWLFRDMLKNTSPVFAKWAMGAALHWDNKVIPPNLYHITGDKDRVFPFQKIKDAVIVKGGTHIMIFDKAKEINKILTQILKK